MKYDYLVVGSGLFGAVFAHEAKLRAKSVIVLEKRCHIGGNIYTSKIEGINVHVYGAHIFHTGNKTVWNYINKFTEFNNFINSPLANYKGEIYNLPFNMNTFNKLWGVVSPDYAIEIINKQKMQAKIANPPANLEEQAISLVGIDLYEKLIKGYTEKQWGRDCKDLPTFIIKRLPVRFIYDNNYYSDKYQGIPIGGYTPIIEKLLQGVEVRLNSDFLLLKEEYRNCAEKIVYTGPIDAFFNFSLGHLEYRSLRFETEILECSNFQGNAVVNYTDRETPYTRIIEHKHFEFGTQPKTVITKEYPIEYKSGEEPYYPINDTRNQDLYKKYKELAEMEKNVIFGGRLAEYKYYDMDKVIESALLLVEKEFQ